MTTELEEAFAPATIDGLARRLFELRAQIADLKSQEQNITTILKERLRKTGEVIEVEGLPPLRLMSRANGMVWDSHAIQQLQEKAPFEWQKLVELGCVSLSATAIREQIKHGQLVRMPIGGYEKHADVLAFDKEKRR